MILERQLAAIPIPTNTQGRVGFASNQVTLHSRKEVVKLADRKLRFPVSLSAATFHVLSGLHLVAVKRGLLKVAPMLEFLGVALPTV